MPNLVGIGLSQVPTNSMLGGMAYQDPEHASIKDLDLKNLSQINSEIVDTAVDIFIYDTSKDSDGGAWRKRTQHTSWYNETLGTTTRGTRREFPAVAVLVLEIGNNGDTALTIYDGDDPDLPMWMVFISNSGSYLQSTCSAVYALNGEIVVGRSGAVRKWNYIDECAFSITVSNTSKNNGNLSQRNSQSGWYQVNTNAIVGTPINDVAMTVLPNAPIDDATGLPIPTIAVATNGGVSVIKDDGTVVDWTESTGPDSTHRVSFRKDGKLGVFTSGTSGIDNYPQAYYITIPNTDVSAAFYYDFNSLGIEKYGYENESISSARLSMKGDLNSTLVDLVDSSDRTYAATDVALNIISRPESIGTTADMRTGMMDFVTSSYNTGWMHGDIKGAFLSDTDTTNVTGTELVTNGTFDTNTSGWSFVRNDGTTTASVSSGQLTLTRGTDSGVDEFFQDITLETGKRYVITLRKVSGNMVFRFNSSTLSQQILNGANTTYSYTVTATGTDGKIRFWALANNTSITVDDVSVRLAEEDRSVNNNGLQVFGTITKSAVATGAELVKYGGFGSGVNANGLVQPYNSDMDWGTGDFHYMVWVYHRDIASLYGIISRQRPGQSSGNRFQFQTDNDGRYDLYSGSNQNDLGSIRLNTWSHLAIVRSGSSVNFYQDGISVRSWIDSTNYTNATAPLRGGGLSLGSTIADNSYGASGVDFALFRTGASAPSPEQIKKIYEDEKFLFQENAACTLYGSSDAVTALAYDEVTDKLHVGTSSGRSEFQGLRRINNTTTAVTTAISVHDEFIAEQ